jgi:hypothetical protein
MMTALGKSPDQNDRAYEPSAEPDAMSRQHDENQLDLFGAAPTEAAGPRMPRAANLAIGSRPADEDGGADAAAAGKPKDGPADGDELRRLETSVRWLLNESSVRHLPPAANLPPVPGLPVSGTQLRADASPPPAADVRRDAEVREDEVADEAAPYAYDPHVYDPRRALPPRSAGRRTAGRLQKLLIASMFAVPPAYFIAKSHALPGFDFAASALDSLEAQVGALLPAPKPSRSQLARAAQQVAAAPSAETRAVAAADFAAEPADAHAGDVPAAAPPDVAEPRLADVASLPAEPPSPPRDNPPANPPAEVGTAQPALSARDIAILVERGRAFFEAGDLAAARLLFRRAANAGDAAAALAMGATYDPVVLADRLVRGLGADAEQARNWYEKARELGSPEGPRRLEMLAHR